MNGKSAKENSKVDSVGKKRLSIPLLDLITMSGNKKKNITSYGCLSDFPVFN